MTIELIDNPLEKYVFERIGSSSGESQDFSMGDEVRTLFIHDGDVTFRTKGLDGREEVLGKEEGIVMSPGLKYTLSTERGYSGFQNTSSSNGKPIIEIFDDGVSKREVPLEDYRIVRGIKKVVKPWGHELWITWQRDHHVMKQIAMNPRQQSSLQFHRKKLETNAIQSGSATIIDAPELDPNTPKEEVQASLEGVDLLQYSTEMTPPNGWWTSIPGHIHRVISGPEGYVAYEVSTPELDDVIRLRDVTGRGSGRIVSEHLRGENPWREK